MLEERTIKILKRAGWNEGRKIDITNQVKMLENYGYDVFEAARKFMEEFGELDIIAKYIDHIEGEEEECYDEHLTSFGDLEYSYKRGSNYDDKVGEQTIPICYLYNGEYTVYISESGKFFIDQGVWAKDSEGFWNGLLGEYKGGFLNWNDYRAGKEFIDPRKYKNEDYF